jgi:hypothetical protein
MKIGNTSYAPISGDLRLPASSRRSFGGPLRRLLDTVDVINGIPTIPFAHLSIPYWLFLEHILAQYVTDAEFSVVYEYPLAAGSW